MSQTQMEIEIPNAELTPTDIPRRVTDAEAFEAFALSFDGYAHWGDRCGPLAEAAARAFHEEGTLPDSTSDLRACLFYEQQRWRWQDSDPDDASVAYLQAILDAIRTAAANDG